jgi:uncharacterized protein (DUF2147 family)
MIENFMRWLLLLWTTNLIFAPPSLADPVHGLWQTKPDDTGHYGHIQITTCDTGRICGSLVAAFTSAGEAVTSDMIGRAIIWDMEPMTEGHYRNGRIYAPDRDRIYSARMELRGETLAVSGCVIGLCRASEWVRAR